MKRIQEGDHKIATNPDCCDLEPRKEKIHITPGRSWGFQRMLVGSRLGAEAQETWAPCFRVQAGTSSKGGGP